MRALWLVYGGSIRGVMLALSLLYAVSSGLLVAQGDPVAPGPVAWATWGTASALFVVIAWRTRAPGPAPAVLALVLIAGYAAVPASAGWLPTTMSVLLVYVAFTSRPRTTVALMLAWMAVYTVVLLVRFDTSADLVGKVAGSTAALTGLVISTALRVQAGRLIAQQRQTDAAVAESEIRGAVTADRIRTLLPAAAPARLVLAELAASEAIPTDPEVRSRCRAAEARLRAALLAAAEGGELQVLAAELVSAAHADAVDVHVQGEESWHQLRPRARHEVARAAAELVGRPGLTAMNLTLLPDPAGVWVSLVGVGTQLAEQRDDEATTASTHHRRGRHGTESWQQWVFPAAAPAAHAPATTSGEEVPGDRSSLTTVSSRPR